MNDVILKSDVPEWRRRCARGRAARDEGRAGRAGTWRAAQTGTAGPRTGVGNGAAG